MAHQGVEGFIKFLQDPKYKPLRDLIELAVNEDKEALNYVEFIQEEISKKFKPVDDSDGALSSMHLSIKIDPKNGQDGIRSIDESITYYFNEYGILKNENEIENNLSFDQYEKIGNELVFYMFYLLIKSYKFKAKVVGNSVAKKKKKKKKNNESNMKSEYKYKTILFSPKFEQCDSIVVIIPPHRGCVCYNSLAIDEGLAYGTMLPYIEKILSWNKKKKKTQSQNNDNEEKDNSMNRKWGVMILDPQGVDSNNNKYSIIKIYDKWLSKRIPSVGLFGGFHPPQHGHQKTGSDESILTTLSTGNAPKVKSDIKNLFFIGCLNNGELISHLLHRRGQSLEKVIKGCIFLDGDDPYDANDITRAIYKRCGINYLNSTLERDAVIEGKKVNGDPYIIKRVSAGNPRYCCQSAFESIIKYIQNAVVEKENDGGGNDESKEDK